MSLCKAHTKQRPCWGKWLPWAGCCLLLMLSHVLRQGSKAGQPSPNDLPSPPKTAADSAQAAFTSPLGPDSQPEAVESLLQNVGWGEVHLPGGKPGASQQKAQEVRAA